MQLMVVLMRASGDGDPKIKPSCSPVCAKKPVVHIYL